MKYIVLKKGPSVNAGDVLFCWDETMDRSITGYIVRVAENTSLNDYDVYIRWNDIFVAFQRVGMKELLTNIKLGLWRYKSGFKKRL